MGQDGDKPRKKRHPLAKVPKYQETNSFPLSALGGGGGGIGPTGRFGHGSDGKEHRRPGWAGALFLGLLGIHPRKEPEEQGEE